MDRRALLTGGVGLAAATLLPLANASFARVMDSTSPDVKALNDRLAVVSGVGCNVVALSGPAGLTLVDDGSSEHTSALLKALRDLPGGKRVRRVFNTHHHADQTGSNEALGKAKAEIIAHQATWAWLAADHYVPAEDRYERARAAAALPTTRFYTTGSLPDGQERIEYGYLLQAHTSGDCYVHFRDSNVIAVGHALSPVRDPELDWFAGGWIGGRLDALTLLLKIANDETRIVPAYGPLLSRTELKSEFDLWQQVYDRSVEYLRKAYNYTDMINAGVLKGLPRTWSDPNSFMYSVCKGLWAHHNMLTHDIV